MAESSRLRQRYSPITVVTTSADALMTHHIQFVGIRPQYRDYLRESQLMCNTRRRGT